MSFTNSFTRRKLWLGAVVGPVIIGIVSVLAVISPPLTSGQIMETAAARPEFAVASVRANTSGTPSGSLSGTDRTRFSATNVTLNLLIRLAWHVREYQVLGGAAWVNSDRFDIVAETEGEVENDRMMPMLQKLLEDRFRLTTRRETRQLPVYVLVVAKGGPKLHAGGCVDVDKLSSSPASSIPCGHLRIFTNGLDGQTSMPLLINLLSDMLARPVVDQTKFVGSFDVRLRWTPDGSTPGDHSGDSLPSNDESDPSFFTALEEQLGLKLESRKGPVETVAIKHAEKPTEN